VVKSAKKRSGPNRAFYIIIAVVAIGGIGGLTYASTRSGAGPVASQYDSTLAPVKSEGYAIGNPSAPVEVTEFGDFECPACGAFATITEPDVRKNFVETGKIRWRFIDFPLNMHLNTWNASRAAACADEQGKFWAYHDLLYATQDRWNGETTHNPDKIMKQLGQQIGLNTDQFDKCVDTKATQAKIQAHLKLGNDRQIEQTPTFFIGGTRVAGELTYDQIAQYINTALAAAPKQAQPAGDSGKASTLGPAAASGAKRAPRTKQK
jgi:protein-disulfide isomerase